LDSANEFTNAARTSWANVSQRSPVPESTQMSERAAAVTFLFTDVEDSTGLLKRLRERYHDALADHQTILRAAFAEHGGREIDTQGDSFFVAFSSPRDAVLSALDAQRGLSHHEWPDGERLQVRMGIHTGAATAIGGRYVGVAVHRASRISDAGHGGQVLVSQTTRSLLEDEELELGGATLRDLGEQRLKGLDRPTRVYQLVAPDLRDAFPALRMAERPAVVGPAPRGRRWWLLRAATGLALAGLAAGVLLITRGKDASVTVPPNSLAAIDPSTNRVIKAIPLGGRPSAITADAGGLWVANIADRTLTRIHPDTRLPEGRISLAGTPTGIAAGPSGVWVFYGLVGTVAHVDPQVGDVVKTISDVVGRSSGGGITLGEDAVWVAGGSGELVRIDLRSSHLTGGLPVGISPSAVAAGKGAVWVANAGSSTVSVVNPRTFSVVGNRSVGPDPRGVAVGEGAIWVTSYEDDTVTRIDPVSLATMTIPVGTGPTGIATGAGAVWVADSEEGTVSRIDPESREVTAIVVGNRPEAIVVSAGVVWVTVQARS
jgi:YVTN family beta-propeller protein